jgi:opacity protein-like surface antigen
MCRKILALAATLLALATSAQAQNMMIGLEGGMSIPTGDAADVANNGFHLGADGTYMVVPEFGIGVGLAYHHWAGSDDLNAATDALLSALLGTVVTGSQWNWSAFQATLHGRLVAPTQGPVSPWLQAGFGVYNVKLKLEALGQSDAENKSKLGLNVGAGLDFRTQTSARVGVGATYHYIPTKDDFGANFTAFTVAAHVRFGVQ